jgi:hypothetical protein
VVGLNQGRDPGDDGAGRADQLEDFASRAVIPRRSRSPASAGVVVASQHETAKSWWEETMNSNELIGLTDPAIFGFLRISTNPRLLKPPLPVLEISLPTSSSRRSQSRTTRPFYSNDSDFARFDSVRWINPLTAR